MNVKEYKTEFGMYKPDLTIITTTDEILYIEIANTNKKKQKDFIDMWNELGNTVVEVETKDIIDGNKIECMIAIWYKGKEYHEQVKELRKICNKEKEKYNFTKEQLYQIDWLINDICKYNQGNLEIDELSDEIQAIEYEKQRQLVCNIVRNKRCGTVLEDYVEYNKNKIKNYKIIKKSYIPRLIYDRLYGKYEVLLYTKELKFIPVYDINKIEIYEEINTFKNIKDMKIELINDNNNVFVCYKNKKMLLTYKYGDRTNFEYEINKFKKEIDNEILKYKIYKNNIFLKTYNSIDFKYFNIEYNSNEILSYVFKEKENTNNENVYTINNLKDEIEKLNLKKENNRKNKVILNKKILKDLNIILKKYELDKIKIKIYYNYDNNHIKYFYKGKEVRETYLNISDKHCYKEFDNYLFNIALKEYINNSNNILNSKMYYSGIKISYIDKEIFYSYNSCPKYYIINNIKKHDNSLQTKIDKLNYFKNYLETNLINYSIEKTSSYELNTLKIINKENNEKCLIDINKYDKEYIVNNIEKFFNNKNNIIKNNINTEFFKLKKYYEDYEGLHISIGKYDFNSYDYNISFKYNHKSNPNLFYKWTFISNILIKKDDYIKYDTNIIIDKINNFIEIRKYMYNESIRFNNRVVELEFGSKFISKNKLINIHDIKNYSFISEENIINLYKRELYFNGYIYIIPISFNNIKDKNERKKYIKNLIKDSMLKNGNRKKSNNNKLRDMLKIVYKYYDDTYNVSNIYFNFEKRDGYYDVDIIKHNIQLSFKIKYYKDTFFIIDTKTFINNNIELITYISDIIRNNIYKK